MGIGGIVSGVVNAGKAAAEKAAEAAEAAKRAAEAAAEAAAKKAAEEAAKAADKVSDGAKKVGDKVSSVAAEQARDVFEGAKDAVSGAADKAKDAAGTVADKAEDVAEGTADKAKEVASGAANQVKGAADRAVDVFEDAGDKVQDVAAAGAKTTGKVLDKATDVAAAGLDKAGQAIQNAPTSDPLQKIGNQIVGGALQTGADVVRDPVETAKAVKDAASINKQVDDLKPGEHVKTELSAEGDVSGIGLKGKGELEVKRDSKEEGDGYTVSVNGELGAGLVGKLGGTGAAEVGGSAFLNAGAKAEFKFKTAEEAKRATDIIAKATLAGAAGAATPLGPVAGAAANKVLGDPMSDLAGLRDNLSAVEVKLNAEAQGSIGVGANGLEGAATASAKAGINGSLGQTARLEFKDGQPSKLSVKQTWQVGAEANGELGLDAPVGKSQGSGQSPGAASGTQGQQGEEGSAFDLPTEVFAGAKGSFKAEFEQSFELPKDFDAKKLLTDPAGTTREIAEKARDTQEAKLTLTDSREGSAKALGLGGSAGQEVKVELKGKVKDIAESGAFQSAVEGDFGQAYRQLEGKVDAKATVQEKTTDVNDVSLGFHAGAGGGEAGIKNERTHLGEKKELTAAQLAELYQRQLLPISMIG
jgi:hypothetical protein